MITIELRDEATARRVVEATRLFTLAESLGALSR
jgi:cystathionine beta-lyase/cystathionine gamma-synthase